MKTVKCDLCDHMTDDETFHDWMTALMPHYKSAHADIMSDTSKTKEDGQKWMMTNKERFDAA